MGSITFLLPNSVPPAADLLLRQACLVDTHDRSPVPTAVRITGDRLVASRGLDESAYLSVLWPFGPFGTYVTTSPTLRERAEPYRLLAELARGKLNQVRTQLAAWQSLGLRTPEDFHRDLGESIRLLATAVTSQQPAEADATAGRVLERSFALADRLARLYVEQLFATRREEEGWLETRFAARLVRPPDPRSRDEYREAFNGCAVGFRWRELEPEESHYQWEATDAAVRFALDADLPVTAGPVIDLSPDILPTWAANWEGDLPTLAAFMCDFVETVVTRYKSDVRRWVVCAGFNHSDGLGLTDDDRLRLAARLIEAALQVDPHLDLVLNVTQPWGDYLTHEEQTISPFAFADDLVRTGLRIAAVELELRCGSSPRGNLPRDLLDTSRLIDHYDHLGLPLEIVLGYPSGPEADQTSVETLWSPTWAAPPTPEGQAEWGASFAALALAKPAVRAVTWDHWTDADPHITPLGGLIDAAGHPKPLLSRLRGLRSTHLT